MPSQSKYHRKTQAPQPPEIHQDRRVLWAYLALFLVPLLLYSAVASFDFVNFDDPDYVTNNAHVRRGVTLDGLRWAFTSGEAANWFPLTRLSHMLDVQLFGVNAGMHHLSNVVLHALATVLLFAFLHRASGALWRSAIVSLVFAVHPLHVESVAWIAERKDVLCAVFWFLSLYLYVRYVQTSKTSMYLLAFASFAVGLLSKPMIVSLPVLLLLVDYWPLRRRFSRQLLLEKVPFVALAAIAAFVTYVVQQSSGAVRDFSRFPLLLRLENAAVSYAVYLLKSFAPVQLAVFYPFPASLPPMLVAGAAAGLVLLTAAVLYRAGAARYLAVGWLWFLITLIPVIGLVQVGGQARADRYMYVPQVGLAIAVVWGLAEFRRRYGALYRPMLAIGVVAALAFTILAWQQIQTWRNSETLYGHALSVTKENYIAQHNLGSYYLAAGRFDDAITHLNQAIELEPHSARAYSDKAAVFAQTGRLDDAVGHYLIALQNEPNAPIVRNNLGNVYAQMPNQLNRAIGEYNSAINLDPNYAEARNNLGVALARQNRDIEARQQFTAALALRPDYQQARDNLERLNAPKPMNAAEQHNQAGLQLSQARQFAEAVPEFQAALAARPDYSEAHNNLGAALAQMPGHSREALSHFEAAVRSDSRNVDAHFNLGVAYAQIPGREKDAISELEIVERERPDPEVRKMIEQLKSGLR